MTLSLALTAAAGAVAAYVWRRRRASATPTLAPLTGFDPRFEGRDFTMVAGHQIIRSGSVLKLIEQLAKRAVKDGGGGDVKSFYLMTKGPGQEDAATWLQRTALEGRGVLLVLDDKPAVLVTVPAAETGKWAQPGRAIVMWGTV